MPSKRPHGKELQPSDPLPPFGQRPILWKQDYERAARQIAKNTGEETFTRQQELLQQGIDQHLSIFEGEVFKELMEVRQSVRDALSGMLNDTKSVFYDKDKDDVLYHARKIAKKILEEHCPIKGKRKPTKKQQEWIRGRFAIVLNSMQSWEADLPQRPKLHRQSVKPKQKKMFE